MRIVNIRECSVPVGLDVENAAIGLEDMTVSAVAIETDVRRDGAPVIGYGFGSIGRYATGGLLRERFIPRLLAARPEDLLDRDGANFDPFRAYHIMMRNEKAGGHGERPWAIGVLDMALWDAVAKIEEKPLFRLLADHFNDGKADDRVAVYASGGHYGAGGPAELQDEILSWQDLGYRRAKIKAGAGDADDDRARVEAALHILGDGGNLAVDMNAAFGPRDALGRAENLAQYGLAWIEEICDPLDYETQGAVCAAYDGPLATGENLFSAADALNLVRYGGLRRDRDLLQFDIPLSYGLVGYLYILDMLAGHGWSRRSCLPHAGHLFAFHAAAGLGLGGHEVAPDSSLPHGGLHDGVVIENGFATPPDLPGIGFEGKENLYRILQGLSANRGV